MVTSNFKAYIIAKSWNKLKILLKLDELKYLHALYDLDVWDVLATRIMSSCTHTRSVYNYKQHANDNTIKVVLPKRCFLELHKSFTYLSNLGHHTR